MSIWKSVIRDYPEEQDEQGNTNPLYDEWVEAILEEPWFVALQELVKWSGAWAGTEEELMREIRLRVDREVWESDDFPADPKKLMEYYGILFCASPSSLNILDYRELKKEDVEDFDVPGWGPEAPILVEQGRAGLRLSYRDALHTLLYKHQSPLPLAVLNFTYCSKSLQRKSGAGPAAQ